MDDQTQVSARGHRWIGLAILALPTAVITLFAVAEGIGGEPGWWGHPIQLAVLVLLAVVAWARPRIGGPLLILLGVVFVGFVAFEARGAPNLAGVAIIAAPFIAAGVFFTLAGRGGPSRP